MDSIKQKTPNERERKSLRQKRHEIAGDGERWDRIPYVAGAIGSCCILRTFLKLLPYISSSTLKRNMTGDFVGMTRTLCNGTLSERRCTYYTVCLCTGFLSWQIIDQGEALVWAKGWFILLHSAVCWAVHLNIRWWTRRVNMLCLSSHRETWTRWSISDISFCVCAGCQST